MTHQKGTRKVEIIVDINVHEAIKKIGLQTMLTQNQAIHMLLTSGMQLYVERYKSIMVGGSTSEPADLVAGD
jgi:hypothetical protein